MKNTIIALLVVVSLLLAGLSGFLANKPAEVVEVPVPFIVEKLVEKNDTLVNEMASDYLESKYDEKLQNDTAKALVLEEYAKKSFKVSLFELLEENFTIDSYKDLQFSELDIEEVELNGEDAVVTGTFKVVFDEFDDEDFTKRLTIEVVFEVEELDVEELEDASVEDYEFKILRVKDLD